MRLTRRRAMAAAAVPLAGCLGGPESPDGEGNGTDDARADEEPLDDLGETADEDGATTGGGDASSTGGWRQFGYDAARTGVAPSATGPTEDLAENWTFLTRDDVRATPVTAGDRVFVGSHNGQFFALGHQYGRQNWFMDGSQPVAGSAAVGDEAVYVGTGDGSVVALGRDQGAEQWRVDTGAVRNHVALRDGAVYVGDRFGNLYKIGAASGRTLWSYTTDRSFTGNEQIGGSGPAVAGDRVFVGTTVTDRDRQSRLHAVDAREGGQDWVKRFEARSLDTTPAVRDGTVYVALDNGSMYALGAGGGSERWRFDSDDYVGFRSSPAVTEETVIVGCDDGVLYGVDRAEGTERWRFEAGDRLRGSPSVAGDAIYVGCDDGNLYVLDRSTGAEMASFATEGAVRSSPAVTDGRVYVGSDDGNLYVIAEDG